MASTNGTGYLSLQANIICLLLALIGSTIVIRHHDWFGKVPTAGNFSAQYQVIDQ